MTKKQPFTKEEKKIMDLIVKAHNLFVELPKNHPDETREWVDGIHRLQITLMNRVVVRDYPDTFYSQNKN